MNDWIRKGIGLAASAAMAMLGVSTLAAAPACPLDPGLDEPRAKCAAGDATTLECVYLASIEALARSEEKVSAELLEKGLGHLGGDTVQALLKRLQLFLLTSLDPKKGDPCVKEVTPMMLRFLSEDLSRTRETPGSAYFVGPMVYPLNDEQIKKLEERNTPEMAARIKTARESLTDLLKRTRSGKGLLNGEAITRAMEFLKMLVSESPTSILPIDPFSLLGKGIDIGKISAPIDAPTGAASEEQVLRIFGEALNAKSLGRFEDALLAIRRGRRLLALLPDSQKTRLLRMIGPRLSSELARDLKQGATHRLEDASAEALKELGGLAGEILDAGLSAPDGKTAALRTAAKMAEALPRLDTSQMETIWDIGTGLMGFDAKFFEAPPAPERIERAKDRFRSLFETVSCIDRKDAAACAAAPVARQAEGQAEGRRQWLEVYAAWLAWQGGDRSPAGLGRARRAIADLESFIDRSYRLDATLAGYLDKDMMESYRLVVGMMVDGGLPNEAFGYAEKSRSWTLRRVLADDRRRTPDPAYADALRRATLAAAPARRDRGAAVDAIENLTLERRLDHPEDYRLAAAQAIELPEVQRSLASDQTLLAYFFADERKLLAWRIEAESSRLIEVEAAPDEWRRLECFQQAAAAGATRGAERIDLPCGLGRDGWGELHRLLIAPAGENLRGELIIVPHGALHRIAFAGLENPAGERLMAGHRLSQVPSVSIWRRLARVPESGAAAAAAAPALVLGDPPGARLPGASREAKKVAALFGVEPFLDRAASESLIYRRTPGPALIHLATHALYDADYPRQSGVLLAASQGGEAQDGRLTALEVEELLDLRGTALVTLSACETALGSLSQGDEVIGLTRSFLIAGSRAVLSTLWKVDDRASARLMEVFYERLKAGETAAGALRLAQLELAGDKATADPYYWAGYSLTGDPRAALRL